jgi:hypothetical protein
MHQRWEEHEWEQCERTERKACVVCEREEQEVREWETHEEVRHGKVSSWVFLTTHDPVNATNVMC